MQLRVNMTYMLELTIEEFRLVSKGLRGTLKPEDRVLAQALQEKLIEEKAAELDRRADQANVALDSLTMGKVVG